MAHTSSLVFAGIAPHPPIMVPEVGGDAIVEVRGSIDAMAALTERVIAAGAETVILISPHAPLESHAFVAYDGPELYGDFANFRAPTAAVRAQLDDELLNEITRAAAAENLLTMRVRGLELDHGTAVPLYFLQRNGWTGSVVALGYSFLSNEDHARFGRCIRQAVDRVGRPVAFIASGDLSHRLKLGAPAGYNPEAHRFDEEVVDAISSCATSRIVEMDQELRRLAGECGYRSMLVAIGLTEGLDQSCEVVSYEAPFGVGYLVAQLLLSEPPADRGPRAGSPLGVVDAGGLSNTTSSASASADVSSTDTSAHRDAWQIGRVDQPQSGGISVAPGVSPGSTPQTESRARFSGRHNSASESAQFPELPALARQVVETFVTTGEVLKTPEAASELLRARAACFVSIKTRAGDLRGCIGTIEPAKDSLAEELSANAISAATADPRFSPVRKDELPNLKYSVDVLSPPEPTTLEQLDPNVYGVIVVDDSGRRGLLLPQLAGIDSAVQQVEIASHKAGIRDSSNVKLFRFRADRYGE
jgi:AmmeMemoRadiSam system protein A/AmmeMemoRadiSam system protein B